MSIEAVRSATQALLRNPSDAEAWARLEGAVSSLGGDTTEHERSVMMTRARLEARREWAAVARLLELEHRFAKGTDVEMPILHELARVYSEELVDPGKAGITYQKILELDPEDDYATEAAEREDGKADKWADIAARYKKEAEASDDPNFKAALLASAADITLRYGGFDEALTCLDILTEARAIDPRNRKAASLAELVGQKLDDWDFVASVLRSVLDGAGSTEERVAAGLRLARVVRFEQKNEAGALAALEAVALLAPTDPDAFEQLRELYRASNDTAALVRLLEAHLQASKDDLPSALELAKLHWKGGKPEAAEPLFERARKGAAGDPDLVAFFRELCTARGESTRLSQILNDAAKATADAAMKSSLLADAAKLVEGQESAQKSIDQYKAVLRADPGNADARSALKRLYTQASSWQPLVELTKQELDRTPQDATAARLVVLRELAALYRDRVKNDATFFGVLGQIAQGDPSDASNLRELCRLAESLGRHRDLLQHQQRLAEVSDDVAERVALLREVARRWLDQFNNAQNAVTAYESLLELAPTDDEAQSKLRELYQRRRAWAALYALAEKQLSGAEGGAKVELLIEMSKLAAERLDKGADAIRLMKEALALDPAAAGLLDALEKQAERERDFASVAEVLERRVDESPDDAARVTVLQKLGAVYADKLKDPAAAARTWKRVLDLQPGHARALRVLRESYVGAADWAGLETLYGSQGDWEGLVDFLSTAADRAADPAQRVDISLRCARIYEHELKAPERAARSYERILSVQPSDLAATRALVPIYENEDKYARLPALYETLVAASDDGADKVALLRKLAAVTGGPLADKSAALLHAQRAYDLLPDGEGLALLEAWSRAAGSWKALVEAVEARLGGKGLEADERRSLELRLADVYAKELGRTDDAVAILKRLVAASADDFEALQTLDEILRANGRKDDLRWLLGLRAERLEGEEQADLYEEWAGIEDEVFGEPERAIDLYRKVVASPSPRRGALRELGRLFRAANRMAEAVEALTSLRDALEGAERAAVELELAELALRKTNDPLGALDACRRALALRPHDAKAVELLGELLAMPAVRREAARTLAVEYEAKGDARREAEVLAVLLESEPEPETRRALHVSLADVHEQKLAAPGMAFDVLLRALNELPSDLALWDRVDELAGKAGRPTDLAEAYRMHLVAGAAAGITLDPSVEAVLCQRAAKLHEEQLGDTEGAIPYLRRVLALEPRHADAFAQLKQILTGADRWSDLEQLYEGAIQSASDAQQLELLAELALVAEDVMGDLDKAIGYHERVLALDAVAVSSLDALEKLYARQSRWGALAGLLERRLDGGTAANPASARLGLGRILLERLSDPGASLRQLQIILEERPADIEARQLVERILELPEQRLKAAKVLEAVYEARDEVRQLVRVLEVLREGATEPDDRRALLRRIASLYDERLKDDASTFSTLLDLVPLAVSEPDVRASLLEVARRLGKSQAAGEALAKAAASLESVSTRGQILLEVAGVYEDIVGDAQRAEEVYRAVLALGDDEPALAMGACQALARIYRSAAAPEKLVEVLKRQVTLELDPSARASLHEQIATLSEESLGNRADAIDAWRARLADDPADKPALAALERLYEVASRWQDLVEVLALREAAETDSEARRRALEKTARTLEEKLERTPDAIDAYERLRSDFEATREVLAALSRLQARAERWPAFADALDAELQATDDAAARVALFVQLGDVRRTRLDDLAGSIDAYRSALLLEPSDVKARAALVQLLEVDDAKKDAAELLAPLYEADDDASGLLRVLVIQADVADDPTQRLEFLERALRTAEGPKADKPAAFALATRGLRDAAAEPSVDAWIEHVERLGEATSKHAELLAVFEAVCADIPSADTQQRLRLRMGELARGPLADGALAISKYRDAVDAQPDDVRALRALEELYEAASAHKELHGVLRQRADLTADASEKRALLYRIAALEEGPLDEPREASSTYEAVLELGLDAKAIAGLDALYRKADRWDELVRLLERQIDEKWGPVADLLVRVAHLARTHLSDTPRAFDELTKALELEPSHPPAVAELEAMLASGEPDDRAHAAELLEPIYREKNSIEGVQRTIEARLDAQGDPAERRQLLQKLATLHEEQRDDYRAALDTVARIFHDDISDTGVFADLERLAKVAEDPARLARILANELSERDVTDEDTARIAKRAGELFAALGDADAALGWYRKAHAFAPESRELFDAIDKLLVKGERHADRAALFEGALEFASDAERVAQLHVIADLYRAKLDRVEDAIGAYRRVLEIDEREERALGALTELYRQLGRHRDLAELFERRAELAADAEQAAPFRLAFADLLAAELDDKGRALDQLEAVAADVPWNKDVVPRLEALAKDDDYKARAIELLRPLYERSDDWRLLVRLNAQRLGLVDSPSEKVVLLRESAELLEKRGDDELGAFEALRQALELDPEDGETRAPLERLADTLGAYEELTESYEKVLERTDLADASRRELLVALARVYDKNLDDPRASLGAFDRVAALDPTDMAPLDAMDDLAILLGDWHKLVEILRRKTELASDADAATLWRRVGRTLSEMLEAPAEAVVAFEKSLELEPGHRPTIDALLDLYQADLADALEGRAARQPARDTALRLVELVETGNDTLEADEGEVRYERFVLAAGWQERVLDRRSDAIASLEAALAAKPSDLPVLSELERLLRLEGSFDALLENLRTQSALAETPSRRVALRVAIAELYLGPLSSPPDALEQLRLALDEAPLDARALELVRQIAETNDDLRLEAAAVLEPLLRAGQRWADVAAVLELSLRSHTEPTERARTLRLLAALQSTELGSPSEALAALLRALDETPEDDSLHAELEPLAASVEGGLARYADAMSARVANVLDADLAKSLHVRIGQLAEEKLADPKRAAEAYAAAVQAVGDQPELLAALDRLYTQLGDAKALAAVLESRVSVADSDAAAAALLHRLATLQLERFDDASQALQTLRTALERDAAHPATRATLEALVGLSADAASARPELFDEGAELLEGVYRVAADHKARAALAGRRIALLTSPSERVRQRLELARILEEGGDARAALDALLAALSDDPVDPDVLAEVERLAPTCDGWSAAAKALEAAIEARGDLASDAQRDTLERLGAWYRDRVTDAGAAERTFERLVAIDPSNEASLRAIETLQRAPGREADLVGTLRRLAKLDSLSGDAAPLRREAKALAEGLGDKEQAEQILREALAVDESDVWALAELCAARQAAADWPEVATLLDRRIELADSAPARAELRYEAADLAASKLGDAAKAIDLYQALFEEDPTDAKASKGLRDLLQKAERFKDLLALLEELSRMADSPEARTTLRLECAAVCLEKLDLPNQAADHLREVLEENPSHERATALLAQLYEREGRDQELADLYTTQLEQAAERGDTARELSLRVKLGEVCESRLGDLPRAIASYDSVLQRDAGHVPALSALARLHEQRGDKAAAAKAVAGLLDVTKGDEAVALTLRLADLHTSLGDADAARAALERGLAVHPARAELRKRLQAAYEQAGAWAELADLVEKGTELTSDTAEQLSLLKRAAEIHRDKRGDQAKVADALERAAALAPTDRDLLLALCDAYSLSGKADKAIEALEKLKESFGKARSKELAVVLLRLAKAHAAAGNEQKAIDELEAASRIDAGNIALLKERGVYSIELARKAEPGAARDAHLERANKSFQALLMQRLDATSPITKAELYFQIAIAASLKGDDKRAVQMLERSLDADKAYAPSKELLAKLKG